MPGADNPPARLVRGGTSDRPWAAGAGLQVCWDIGRSPAQPRGAARRGNGARESPSPSSTFADAPQERPAVMGDKLG